LFFINFNEKAAQMTRNDALHDIKQLEDSLWEAADRLRANSKLTRCDFLTPR